MAKWYEEQGKFSDVIISSRVRLARNLKKYPFSPKLSDEKASQMIGEITQKLVPMQEKGKKKSASNGFQYYDISHMEDSKRLALVERHVISPAIAEKKQETGLLVTENESLSIMLNEEDHLRIQAFAGAMNAKKVLKEVNRLDDWVTENLDIAYHDNYGYLTTCPTNVGTGMRASYMMFLPALDLAGQINQLIEEAGKLGIAFRGMYGEGTKASAGIYQISNQKTLGGTEEEIIEKLNNIVHQIIHQERKRRDYLLNANYNVLEDQIYRAYGSLKYTKQITTKDAMTLLSQVKFGVDTNVIKLKDTKTIFQLLVEIQPGNLQQNAGRVLGNVEKDRQRAEYLNQNLPEFLE